MSETFWMDNEGRIGGTDDGEPFIQNRTPEMFAEYRERGFNWVEMRQTLPEEIEPCSYWGHSS